jgi:hypothetical protein
LVPNQVRFTVCVQPFHLEGPQCARRPPRLARRVLPAGQARGHGPRHLLIAGEQARDAARSAAHDGNGSESVRRRAGAHCAVARTRVDRDGAEVLGRESRFEGTVSGQDDAIARDGWPTEPRHLGRQHRPRPGRSSARGWLGATRSRNSTTEAAYVAGRERRHAPEKRPARGPGWKRCGGKGQRGDNCRAGRTKRPAPNEGPSPKLPRAVLLLEVSLPAEDLPSVVGPMPPSAKGVTDTSSVFWSYVLTSALGRCA